MCPSTHGDPGPLLSGRELSPARSLELTLRHDRWHHPFFTEADSGAEVPWPLGHSQGPMVTSTNFQREDLIAENLVCPCQVQRAGSPTISLTRQELRGHMCAPSPQDQGVGGTLGGTADTHRDVLVTLARAVGQSSTGGQRESSPEQL